jgi:hypothetical protein
MRVYTSTWCAMRLQHEYLTETESEQVAALWCGNRGTVIFAMLKLNPKVS